MKTILILGGTPYQIPVIQYAKSQGHRVLTCDYLPNNPGHRLADAYFNVSTTDRQLVLKLAQEQSINGILAFASDPAAPTAAYVADQMGLPGNSINVVETMTQKDTFRTFLRDNGFKQPQHVASETLNELRVSMRTLNFPMIIKPVDSSGSKGVQKVCNEGEVEFAFNSAMQYSRAGKVIVEEWIKRAGYQIAGDGFAVDGELVFHCLGQEHFVPRANEFVPIGESFPLDLPEYLSTKVIQVIQRCISCVGFKTGCLNFDIAITPEEDVFLIEIGPRSGGNLIHKVIEYATGVDLAKSAVDAALGLNCSDLHQVWCDGYYASLVIHSQESGYFESITVSESLDVVSMDVYADVGSEVHPFVGSHRTIGILIARFRSHEDMIHVMDRFQDYYKVNLSTLSPLTSTICE